MTKIVDLYTAKDISNARKEILRKQKYKDACIGVTISEDQAVLDHAHDDEQMVRAVLHRQTNAAIGQIENLYKRFMSFWYDGTLPEFLRDVANYLEKRHESNYRHPGWIKKARAMFNKLDAQQQRIALEKLGSVNHADLSNQLKRKQAFSKLIRQRKHSAVIILNTLRLVAEQR